MQHTLNLKHKSKKNVKNSVHPMSVTTKDFIQKICYRRAASVDMTRHGFMSDSRTRPIGLLLRPLRDKLRTICENNSGARSRNSSPISLMKYNLSDERQRQIRNRKIHFSSETDNPATREEKMKQKTALATEKGKKAINRSPNASLWP